MKLQPPEGRKSTERILIMGGYKSGKTESWIDIARKTTNAHFYVIDTDISLPKMIEDEDQEVQDRITYDQPEDWLELTATLATYRKQLRPQDWLVVDMISTAWEFAQEAFSMADYKTNSGDENPMAYWKEVKESYHSLLARRLVTNKFNVLLCAPTDEVRSEKGAIPEDKAILSIYGQKGVKPRGNKETAHLVHSVIMLRSDYKDDNKRMMSTVRADRKREHMEGVIVRSFAKDYLMKVGGWELVVDEESEGQVE